MGNPKEAEEWIFKPRLSIFGTFSGLFGIPGYEEPLAKSLQLLSFLGHSTESPGGQQRLEGLRGSEDFFDCLPRPPDEAFFFGDPLRTRRLASLLDEAVEPGSPTLLSRSIFAKRFKVFY